MSSGIAPGSSAPLTVAVRFVLRQTLNLVTLFTVIALAAGFPSTHPAVRTALVLIGGYFLFNLTSLFHETAHLTLPAFSRTANVMVGRIIGVVLLVPYTVYRESHIRHHAYLNRPNDWELWPYSDPKTSLTFRRIFVWFDLLFGFLTAPFTYARTYFHPDSPIRQPGLRRTILAEYAVMFFVWGSLLWWVTAAGHWPTFLLCWGIPHWFAGILQNGRKLTEHLGMASFDPLQGTRTVIGGNWFSRLCSWLNYDIFVHGPHHRFPLLTHDKLEGRIRQYTDQHPERSFPVFSSYFRAFCAMTPCLISRPGVGLNAGAAGLNEVTREDVDVFLEDEKQIVVGDWDTTTDVPADTETAGAKQREEHNRQEN